jgi:Family of unknown function (DUF6056)
LSLLVTGNTCNGIIGLRNGVPQNWKRMNHRRDHLITEAVRRGATRVEVPMRDFAATYLANCPRTYFFVDITEDPTWWANRYVAYYYGVQCLCRVPPAARPSAKAERQAEVVGLRPQSATISKR